MSNPGGEGSRPEAVALAALERAVLEAVKQLRDLTRRVEEAEAKSSQFETVVGRFTGNEHEAGRLLGRLGKLDEENAELRERLEEGRAGIERLLARIRFLEDQR